MISGSTNLVAPAPRRPIALIAKHRRERERERERQRQRSDDSEGLFGVSDHPRSLANIRASPYSIPSSLDSSRRPSSSASAVDNSSPRPSASRSGGSRRGSSNVVQTIHETLASSQSGLIDQVDRLRIGSPHLLNGSRGSDDQVPNEDHDVDLLDPDLTPTKARLKLMKRSLHERGPDSPGTLQSTDSGAGALPSALAPDSPTRRLSGGAASSLQPTSADNPAMTSPGHDNHIAAAPATPHRRDSSHQILASWTHQSASPVAEEEFQGHLLSPSCTPPTCRTTPSRGLVFIPPSPISRLHTRNPFTKSFS